ncbi:glycosyltransferase family 4 protein [Salegentibacter sp. T436]|uniref:glycosyltransferase family 4 protein n=1 Tax=Salegentibacter sp. T436 TaxID=1729720 RepID=UPI00094A72FD|nr:glycosyltransferase family 4 protein [Salegentibacter sp. T436]APS39311.1 hypothetical protein AO058_10690 [Salegentibacter sp. T436]
MKDVEKKPIVLFIIDSLEIGGAEKSLLEITQRFKKYKPVFLTLYKGNSLLKEFEKKNIEVITLNQKKSIKKSDLLNQIQVHINRIEPCIVHATLLTSCLISRKLKKRGNSFKLINSLVNNTYSLQRYKTLRPLRALKLFKTQIKDFISAHLVDSFFSNSLTIKNTTSRAIFLKKDRIKVIYRGRNPKSFYYKKNDKLKKELFPDAERIFLNVGRLIPQKGQSDLIKAFAIYIKSTKNLDSLAIAGSGPNMKNLKDLAKHLGISNHIQFLGRRDDISDLLNIADYFVFPSYYEGLPGSLIEAIFSKTPIIASNIPENLECVNEDTALIYKKGDIDDLCQKINYARDNKFLLTEKLEHGYKYALENFQIQEICNIYEREYGNILGYR